MGHAAACAYLGDAHRKGIGVGKSQVLAASFYRQACMGQHTDACFWLAWMFQRGEGVRKDAAEAATLFERACELGSPGGCFNVALTQRDTQSATKYFAKACETGLGAGCRELGVIASRQGDRQAAADLYQQGCSREDATSCTMLAMSYKTGVGVKADPAHALRLFRLACDKGNANACTEVKKVTQAGR